jgi:signal peptidase II
LKVLYFTLGVIVADQVSKFYIKGIEIPFLNFSLPGMYPGQSIPIIGDFFKITFIENPGMAFGFNPGSDFKLWISIFSIIASIGLIYYLFMAKNKSLSLRIALAMILGGAIGNLIDRAFYGLIYNYAPVFYGKVVDFLDFDFFNFAIFGRNYDRWPIFNIADASVTIGVLILIIFYKREKEENVVEETVETGSTVANANIDSGSGKVTDSQDITNVDEDVENNKGKEISF